MSSCPSEVIKLDLGNSAQRLNKIYQGRVRFADYSGSGIETTFTQGEDNCLKSLVEELPNTESKEKNLIVAGTIADVVEDQFKRIFEQLGVENVSFLPARNEEQMSKVGDNTYVLLAQPYLGETTRSLLKRGAKLIQAPFPFGAEGTLEWLRSVAKVWNIPEDKFESVISIPLARARRALTHYQDKLAGKSITFLPDSQLEIPLARFLSRECDMKLKEVGVPFFDRQIIEAEMNLLPVDVTLTEGQV